MDIDGVEINFPDQLKNIIFNSCFTSLIEDDVERIIMSKVLKLYNKHNISSETAMKIFQEQNKIVAEVKNLYGGGETDEQP